MDRLPSLFISHGAPTFAIEPGAAGALLTQLGKDLPAPLAILVVSPHWMTAQPRVCSVSAPHTIHDFGGFPQALYTLEYPAKGHPHFAMQALQLLQAAGWNAQADDGWGLDHGAWVPLRYLYPAADIPVFQVSMPSDLTAESALRYGETLAPLADQGVLIIGSGSLTHNLREFRAGETHVAPYVTEFVDWIRAAAVRGDKQSLVQAMRLAPNAQRAHPSDDHLLPLMVALGAAADMLPVSIIDGGVQHGVLSMESYAFGWQRPAHSNPSPDTVPKAAGAKVIG